MKMFGVAIAASAAVWITPGSALAQKQKADQEAFSGSPMGWKIEPILERNVSHMTRRYNLTENQAKYTRGLMTSRVKSFLTDYEDDVRWMAFELWDYQMKGEIPPPEIVKEWGARAEPLVAAIRKEMFDGNDEWRRILSEEQKKTHDQDLDLMGKQFDEFQEKVTRWKKTGRMEPADLGRVSKEPHRVTIRDSEDAWSYFVRRFISDYELDEGQKQTAYSLLNQLKREAAEYRNAHKEEFDQLKEKVQQIQASAPTTTPEERKQLAEKVKQIQESRIKLEEPISGQMFTRLKEELLKIPRVDQRRKHESHLKRLDLLAKGEKPSSRPAKEASGDDAKQKAPGREEAEKAAAAEKNAEPAAPAKVDPIPSTATKVEPKDNEATVTAKP